MCGVGGGFLEWGPRVVSETAQGSPHDAPRISMPIAIEVPRGKMLEISLFGLFKDELFVLDFLQPPGKCLLEISIDKTWDLIAGG